MFPVWHYPSSRVIRLTVVDNHLLHKYARCTCPPSVTEVGCSCLIETAVTCLSGAMPPKLKHALPARSHTCRKVRFTRILGCETVAAAAAGGGPSASQSLPPVSAAFRSEGTPPASTCVYLLHEATFQTQETSPAVAPTLATANAPPTPPPPTGGLSTMPALVGIGGGISDSCTCARLLYVMMYSGYEQLSS